MMEGSGTGSVSLTNGSGSGRPKNISILRIRIRIRNTALNIPLESPPYRLPRGPHGKPRLHSSDQKPSFPSWFWGAMLIGSKYFSHPCSSTLPSSGKKHWLIDYIDTKSKCRHTKKLTYKVSLRQVFITLSERIRVMLVFSAQLCELLPL
jgi:hypothetical protein